MKKAKQHDGFASDFHILSPTFSDLWKNLKTRILFRFYIRM